MVSSLKRSAPPQLKLNGLHVENLKTVGAFMFQSWQVNFQNETDKMRSHQSLITREGGKKALPDTSQCAIVCFHLARPAGLGCNLL